MGGGILQLVSRGPEDLHLTGSPEVSFFRSAYRRHSNFAIESVKAPFDTPTVFGKRITCTLPRSGDMVGRMYVRLTLPEVHVPPNRAFRWLNYIGLVLFERVQLLIGGKQVDSHTGEFLYLWNQLTQAPGKFTGYANMVGNVPVLTNPTYNDTQSTVVIPSETLYVPLEFWFNRDPSLALPLLAMKYHDVRVNIELRPLMDCMWSATKQQDGTWSYAPNEGPSMVQGDLTDVDIYADYVLLDDEERRMIAESDHEYVVTQVQAQEYVAAAGAAHKVRLNFEHPCKELVFVCQREDFVSDIYGVTEVQRPGGKQWFNFSDAFDKTYLDDYNFASNIAPTTNANPLSYVSTLSLAPGGANAASLHVSFDGGKNPVRKAVITINGTERTSEREGKYYNVVVPYQVHKNVPQCGVCVTSFAIDPESSQPSGSLNMSRVDAPELRLTLSSDSLANGRACKVRVYAINTNVLRISGGLAGMVYQVV